MILKSRLMSFDERTAARIAMFDCYGEVLSGMYAFDDGIFEVVYPTKVKATLSSFTEETMSNAF